MKSIIHKISYWIPAFAAVALLTVSCEDTEEDFGVDSSLPGAEYIAYDSSSSGSTSAVVYWDTEKGDAAGAISWTVQLLSDLTDDSYDGGGTISKKLDADESTTHNVALFSSLSSTDQYYVRVRANYPKSKCSEWVYLESSGEKAMVSAGYGIIDLTLDAPETVTYEEDLSTDTAMGFSVTAEAASASGASEIIVMLLPYLSSGTTYTKTLDAGDTVEATFLRLTKGDRYYVYARASYLQADGSSVFSNWTMAEEEGMTLYEVGKGIVEDVVPSTELVYATSSTLIFSWSECDWEDISTDQNLNVRIQLYNDADCSDLVVAWTFEGNPYGSVSSSYKVFYSYAPCFCFSGLNPGTTYYFVVTDSDTGLSSEPLAATTDDFEIVEVSGSAVAGDVILAENFGELTVGGDLVNRAPGFSSTSRNSFTSQPIPSGEQPDGTYSAEYYGNEVGFFNTMANSVGATRLDNWCTINEGSANSYVCERPGCLKLGASSYTAHITTPILTSLTGIANIEVSFKAARYATDSQEGAVYIVRDGTVDSSHILSDATKSTAATYTIPSSDTEWGEFSVSVNNVTSDMRIAIGVAPRDNTSDAGSVQKRVLIRDVVITLKEYVDDITVDTPANLTLSATSTTITATWDAGTADYYTVEYKESSSSDWIVAGTTTETSYTISDLTLSTSYDVRVKATYLDIDSEYAQATVTTEAASSIPTQISTAEELVAWLAGANDSSTGEYKIVNDIDMSGMTISSSAGFVGTLDGQGYSIKNLSSEVPLFESIASEGVVKNIVIASSCTFTPSDYIFGTIARVNNGTISGCTNNAAVTYAYDPDSVSEAALVAGIAGVSLGSVSECINNGDITVTSSSTIRGGVAGVVAYQGAAITDCSNYGAVTQNALYAASSSVYVYDTAAKAAHPVVGGVVAYTQTSGFSMSNCNNYGTVTMNHTAIENAAKTERLLVGGVVGDGNGQMTSCTNYGEVVVNALTSTGEAFSTSYMFCVGGVNGGSFYGGTQGAYMTSCVNEGTVTVDIDAQGSLARMGGVVGFAGGESATTHSVTSCVNNGKFVLKGQAKCYVGGVAGGSTTISDCTAGGSIIVEGAMSNGAYIGGLVGYNNTQNITDFSVDCTIETSCTVAALGGLIGYCNNQEKTHTGSSVKAVITSDSSENTTANTGLLVGLWAGKTKTVTIGSSDSPVKVSGSVLGNTLSSSDYTTYLSGTTNESDEYHLIYAEYGE